MTDVLALAGHALAAFFAIMNPIGNMPIFTGVVGGLSAPQQRKAALKSCLLAFVIVAVFCVAGSVIFQLFGITMPAFRIAGGLVLLVVGFELLHGRSSHAHHPTPDEQNPPSPNDVAISPLAVPILAGPGTIATAVGMLGPSDSLGHFAVVATVVGTFGLMCAVTCVSFLLAEKLVALMGSGLVSAATRLMGLLMMVIAVQMLIAGITGAIHGYTQSKDKNGASAPPSLQIDGENREECSFLDC